MWNKKSIRCLFLTPLLWFFLMTLKRLTFQVFENYVFFCNFCLAIFMIILYQSFLIVNSAFFWDEKKSMNCKRYSERPAFYIRRHVWFTTVLFETFIWETLKVRNVLYFILRRVHNSWTEKPKLKNLNFQLDISFILDQKKV